MSSQFFGIEEGRKRLGDLVTAVQQGADVVLTRNGKPAARLIRFEGVPPMTTTTEYGTWTRIEPTSATLWDTVVAALGEHYADFDVDAISRDWRQAINEALPEGVSLNGDDFYGPAYDADKDFDGYPLDEHGNLDLKTIVDSVDFWEIAGRHDTSE